jgi:hypothetical protein
MRNGKASAGRRAASAGGRRVAVFLESAERLRRAAGVDVDR